MTAKQGETETWWLSLAQVSVSLTSSPDRARPWGEILTSQTQTGCLKQGEPTAAHFQKGLQGAYNRLLYIPTSATPPDPGVPKLVVSVPAHPPCPHPCPVPAEQVCVVLGCGVPKP